MASGCARPLLFLLLTSLALPDGAQGLPATPQATPPIAVAAPASAPAPASTAPASASTVPIPIDPASVNAVALTTPVGPGDEGAAVLKAQVLLERARYSPGEIDDRYGSNLRRALLGFQASRGLKKSGLVDAPTWAALNRDTAPVLASVAIEPADVAGPFQAIPKDIQAQAGLEALGYASPLEGLGERYHVNPDLLARLNPGRDFSRAGETIVVPMVQPAAPLPTIDHVLVDKSDSTVQLIGSDGKVAAQYPASTGSVHDPLPIGRWKILGVGRHPSYHYNPRLFWDAKGKQSKAVLPPGPNNPVGVVWVDLSKDHYGIHGTPEPSRIGKTTSHGCIRLANWSAQEVSDAVRPNMPAILEP